MKLLIDYCKKKILNFVYGNELTNTKLRNLIALNFMESIRKRSIVGNNETNVLSYDTMYTIYLPELYYKRIKKELIFIVQATTREFEFILKKKVDSRKFSNYNTPHSPYWQFLFQPVPQGAKIPMADKMFSSSSIYIDSETFPEGRDKNTRDQSNKVRVSIRSTKSTGMKDTYFNKDAFYGVNQISESEFVVPFGKLSSTSIERQNKNALLTLSISNASFLVDGESTNVYQMTSEELFIAGRNANESYNGVHVLRVADTHIMNPHLHIVYSQGEISISAKGEVSYRNRKIDSNSVIIPKGSSIVLNKKVQIEIY